MSTSSARGAIRILGIDPGLRNTGWGVIESDGVRLSYVGSGRIMAATDAALAYRLREIFEELSGVIASFRPREAAVEETFVNDNARATLKLGQARGIALLVPAINGVAVAEYAPNLIKKTVVGAGHADKRQIATMVGFLLPQAKGVKADEADALAIAICHANHRSSPAHRLKSISAELASVPPGGGARSSAAIDLVMSCDGPPTAVRLTCPAADVTANTGSASENSPASRCQAATSVKISAVCSRRNGSFTSSRSAQADIFCRH